MDKDIMREFWSRFAPGLQAMALFALGMLVWKALGQPYSVKMKGTLGKALDSSQKPAKGQN